MSLTLRKPKIVMQVQTQRQTGFVESLIYLDFTLGAPQRGRKDLTFVERMRESIGSRSSLPGRARFSF